MLKKLAIVTTHPIQYYAPLFRLLAQRNNVKIKVFYTWGEQARHKVFDPGFGNQREWDIPLLDGYDFEFVKNVSSNPGSSHFKGIVNPGLIDSIKDFKADAILVFGWAFKSHLKLMRYFKGKIPVYFRGDSTLLDEHDGFSIKKTIRRIFLRWVYRHIDIAFYVGTHNKAYFEAHGVKDKRLIYAPHAIDNIRFDDPDGNYAQQAKDWRDKLNIPAGKLSVLFAGKLEQKKNPMFMVEAAKLFPQIHFVIIGNGVLENQIKQQVAGLLNITILPFQNQSMMPVVYRLADVFVLPSKGPGETWGLAINEAMACGKIVVASNKCGCSKDLIMEGKNGFVIEPSFSSFRHVMEQLLNFPSLLERGGKVSYKHIQFFTFSRIAESIEGTIYNSPF